VSRPMCSLHIFSSQHHALIAEGRMERKWPRLIPSPPPLCVASDAYLGTAHALQYLEVALQVLRPTIYEPPSAPPPTGGPAIVGVAALAQAGSSDTAATASASAATGSGAIAAADIVAQTRLLAEFTAEPAPPPDQVAPLVICNLEATGQRAGTDSKKRGRAKGARSMQLVIS